MGFLSGLKLQKYNKWLTERFDEEDARDVFDDLRETGRDGAEEFISQFQEGDELWAFEEPVKDDYGDADNEEGAAIVRDGKVIAVMLK